MRSAWTRPVNTKPEMVEFLLRRGAQVTLPDDLAWATPIALAAHRGHYVIVLILKAYETMPGR